MCLTAVIGLIPSIRLLSTHLNSQERHSRHTPASPSHEALTALIVEGEFGSAQWRCCQCGRARPDDSSTQLALELRECVAVDVCVCLVPSASVYVAITRHTPSVNKQVTRLCVE